MVIGMVMVRDKAPFDTQAVLKEIQAQYDFSSETLSERDSSIAFHIGEHFVTFAYMDFPIPPRSMAGLIPRCYHWPTVIEEIQEQQSHIIVGVSGNEGSRVRQFRILTSVIAAVLRNTNAIGVYQGSQRLLISKLAYLEEAEDMSDDYLPLNVWLYFGFTLGTDTHSAYTDGLKLFNKPEIEIMDSAQPLGKMRLLLLTVSHWVLKDDYALVDGAAFRMKTGEVISIQLSPGRSLEEQTYKLGF